MQDQVTVHIEAPPTELWEFVADVTNTGRLSPETFEVEWLDGVDAPEVGARFRGHVRRNEWGPTYWSVCRVTHCVPGEEFGFAVLGPDDRVLNNWHYRFTPAGSGTDVTESFRLEPSLLTRLYTATLGRARRRYNVRNMRVTLERLKAIAECTEPPAQTTRGTNRDLTVSDHVDVQATPDQVWQVIADPTRIPAFSPENTGADTPRPGPLQVGDRFTGTNRRGWARWATESVVVASDPGERFAFRVERIGVPPALVRSRIATWEYRLEPIDGGTRVTEIWHDDRRWPDAVALRVDPVLTGGRTFDDHQRRNLRRSLARLRDLVEASSG